MLNFLKSLYLSERFFLVLLGNVLIFILGFFFYPLLGIAKLALMITFILVILDIVLFVRRRYSFESRQTVPVYPSYIQMRKYELLAISNRLTEGGIKKLRKPGISTEFEQIREYVPGDDYRTLNWKATARKGALMV